ncbi:hypothetical protein M0Q97_05320 [Candidatus Dojkabacteria bacterium]|jgi:hypothetical protein|nr:hypothetical protein [Candidatus Dojkabacteria bacterium]
MKKIKSFEQYFESEEIDKKSENNDEIEEADPSIRIPSKYSKEELLKKGFVPKKGGGYEKIKK